MYVYIRVCICIYMYIYVTHIVENVHTLQNVRTF